MQEQSEREDCGARHVKEVAAQHLLSVAAAQKLDGLCPVDTAHVFEAENMVFGIGAGWRTGW